MHAERSKLSEALESQRNTEMETLDTDQELTNEKAARLQVHSGNKAIPFNRSAGQPRSGVD